MCLNLEGRLAIDIMNNVKGLSFAESNSAVNITEVE